MSSQKLRFTLGTHVIIPKESEVLRFTMENTSEFLGDEADRCHSIQSMFLIEIPPFFPNCFEIVENYHHHLDQPPTPVTVA